MARFPASFLDELRTRLPVSEVCGRRVKLKKAGREWKGMSPFNKEKTPSFFANDNKAAWFDFSSGKNGNIFDFVMQTEGVSFPESVERLAAMAGIALPQVSPEAIKQEEQRRSLRDVVELAAAFYEGCLGDDSSTAARAYLGERGISEDLVRRFRIGWAPDARFVLKEYLGAKGIAPEHMIEAGLLIHGPDIPVPYDRFRGRIMFPIADARGRIVGFGGRAMGDEQPKYLNSPEGPLFHKGSLLYNYQGARLPAFKGEPMVVVEGYVDVIAMCGAGYPATVAPLGTALGAEQLALLWRASDEPIICFDGDDAGKRAMDKAIDTALPMLSLGKSLSFAVLPNGQDPDDLARKGGGESVRRMLDLKRPFVDALWTRESAPVLTALTTPDKRAVFEERIKRVIATIADDAVRKHYGDDLMARTRTLLKAPPEAVGGPPLRKHSAEYDYEDLGGGLLYQAVVLSEPEGLTFRRPALDEDGVWIWGLVAGEYMRKGAGHDWYRFDEVRYVEWGCQERRQIEAVSATVPYKFSQVAQAIEDEMIVWVCRSEEVADALAERGLVATANAGGARQLGALVKSLAKADVIILTENDDAGRHFAHAASTRLRGVTAQTRVLDVSQFWSACPPGGGLVDWWDAGGTDDDLWKIVETINPWRPEPPKSMFGALRFVEIDLPSREHEWLIKGVLTRGEQSFLAGARSSGKSFAALDLAFTVARAVEEPDIRYFGRRVLGGLTIYQGGEGKLGLRKRMRAYRDFHEIPSDRDLPLVLMPRELDLHANDDHTDKFILECKAWSSFYDQPVELVVIDTFAKATPGANENDVKDMSRVMERGQRICDALRCHVMYVHHLNAGGTKVRGHSSLMAGVENAIEFTETDRREDEEVDGRTISRTVREAKITKQKDEESGGHWSFVLKQVIVGRDRDGDPITSCVVFPTNEASLPATTNARRDSTGIMLNPGRLIFFRDGLLKAINEHGVAPPPGLRVSRSVERVVDWNNVKIEYRRKVAPDEAKAQADKDKIKTYVKRYREFFQAAGVMATDSVEEQVGDEKVATHYVWLTGKPVFGTGFAWPQRKKVEPDRTPMIDPVDGRRLDEDLPF